MTPGRQRSIPPEVRAAMLEDLDQASVLRQGLVPDGRCVVNMAVNLLSASQALGDFDLPASGVRSFVAGRSR